jgi:clorobiocin biosynthesis protein CloN6
MLSPESHDPEISRLAGRGTYTMEQMEAWLPRAWDAGVRLVVVWFFIGMRKQTAASVMETVDYCERLMSKFPNQKVLPLLCPMVPFLDPGSRFFEEPEAHGYRIFHRTFDQHRAAMVEPSWSKRLNYETIWMSRREIQDVSYRAVDRVVQAKMDCGFLPRSLGGVVRERIRATEALLAEVEACVARDGRITGGLRDVVRGYNRQILGYSSDQIIPTERPLGGRWFDDYTVPASLLDGCLPVGV